MTHLADLPLANHWEIASSPALPLGILNNLEGASFSVILIQGIPMPNVYQHIPESVHTVDVNSVVDRIYFPTRAVLELQ